MSNKMGGTAGSLGAHAPRLLLAVSPRCSEAKSSRWRGRVHSPSPSNATPDLVSNPKGVTPAHCIADLLM